MEKQSAYGDNGLFADSNTLTFSDKMVFASPGMATFEISESRSKKKTSKYCIWTVLIMYLLVLTGILGLLAYQVFFKIPSDINSMRQVNSSPTQEKMLGNLGNVTVQNQAFLGTKPQRDENYISSLKEEIHLLKLSNQQLQWKIANVTGIPGIPGLPGAQGEKGETGSVGPKGEKGNTGESGAPGVKGEKGLQGIVGPAGPKGEPGIKGQIGYKGAAGSQGIQGEVGAKGDMGPRGLQGATGEKGEKGDQGPRGIEGPSGTPGIKGVKGDPGRNGLPGQPGPKGTQGEKGAASIIPGPRGEKGDQGQKGSKGEPGSPGFQGPKGEKGSTVAILENQVFAETVSCEEREGPSGTPGIKGVKGDSGRNGLPGQPGPKGPQGEKGEASIIPGPQGEKGDKGQKGSKGEPGSPGIQGPKGEKGRTGGENIRLVGGSKRGRVEIFYNEQWGTICDDSWDINDGTVVCRMLGFQSAINTFTAPPGIGRIWLDDVECAGSEWTIHNCRKRNWGENNCSHGEDAGVECS